MADPAADRPARAVNLTPLDVSGAFLVSWEPHPDERGSFTRTWCADELGAAGLETTIAQGGASWNRSRGTLRGMHYQTAPHEEVKFVRCTRGAIFDVVVDLRADSPTFRRWAGIELAADRAASLYAPAGTAHGFITLQDDTEVTYLLSHRHEADSARGVRYDDPAFGIEWPIPAVVISDRDAAWPDFEP
jgi:dTDP-4-dehydrorhamnose 3,5-epimerase